MMVPSTPALYASTPPIRRPVGIAQAVDQPYSSSSPPPDHDDRRRHRRFPSRRRVPSGTSPNPELDRALIRRLCGKSRPPARDTQFWSGGSLADATGTCCSTHWSPYSPTSTRNWQNQLVNEVNDWDRSHPSVPLYLRDALTHSQ